MATLPKHIQAQVEAAEAFLAQGQTQQEPAAPAVDLAKLATDPEPVQQPAAVPMQETPPAPVEPPAVPEATWEHKFKTLQGLFNAEVPKLQRQIKEMDARYQQAAELLEKATKQQDVPAQQVKPASDPRDVENFGSDLVEMVQRVTQQMLGGVAQKVDGVVGNFEQRLMKVEQQLKGTSETLAYTAEETFYQKLTTAVPEWEQINADQRFLNWLSEVDPMLGMPRQAALDAAQQGLNAARAAAIFDAFKKTLPQPVAQKVVNPVSKQVSPSAVASAVPVPTEKPIVKQQQIVDFYNAKRRGEFRGRDAEASNIEAAINLAIAEGRVQ